MAILLKMQSMRFFWGREKEDLQKSPVWVVDALLGAQGLKGGDPDGEPRCDCTSCWENHGTRGRASAQDEGSVWNQGWRIG